MGTIDWSEVSDKIIHIGIRWVLCYGAIALIVISIVRPGKDKQ